MALPITRTGPGGQTIGNPAAGSNLYIDPSQDWGMYAHTQGGRTSETAGQWLGMDAQSNEFYASPGQVSAPEMVQTQSGANLGDL